MMKEARVMQLWATIVAALLCVLFALLSTSFVAVSLLRIEDGVPHLLRADELRSARDHAVRLLFHAADWRLAAFFAQQAALLFVSVLGILGALTRTPRLLRPFGCFLVGEVVYAVVRLERQAEVAPSERAAVFRVLMHCGMLRLCLPLLFALGAWAASRTADGK
ncbi:hypothetical protein M3Y99_01289600 [Aphelenchoides fujianensis]|nr:hypothetical protein M3Y99_01289600 [Aphelenchoides fujianensis]